MSTFTTQAQTVNPTVAEIEAGISAAEGSYTVEGVYYACSGDAARVRRAAAERRVRDAARRAAWLAEHPCVFCGQPIGDARFSMAGLEPIHAERCAAELDTLLYGDDTREVAA